MRINELKKKILFFAGLYISRFLINVLLLTVKIKIENPEILEKLTKENQNFTAVFWHGKMLIGWYLFRKYNSAALISPSKDGEILTNLLVNWNYKIVRGSSNDSGKDALQKMLVLADKKMNLIITPDGPKGPAEKMKAGAVVICKKKKLPLLLSGIRMEKKKRLKSWDSFEIPLPFSSVIVTYSNPIWIEESLSYDETNEMILKAENELKELNKT
ncbi:MAG: lysophospholipid acyltransferase family protein [Melioribacteraceae bacterium]|nr:lysophospholipid acyltransferase family protein [Melioribacteraceae bacterium]